MMTPPTRRCRADALRGRRAIAAITAIAAAIAGGAAFLGSCAPSPSTQDAEAPSDAAGDALVQVEERGPVKVTFRVEPRSPTYDERIRYSITVVAAPGVEIRLPAPGADIPTLGAGSQIAADRFILRDYLPVPETFTADGKRTLGQSYELEVLTSGDIVLPPTTVRFVDRRDAAGEAGHAGGEAGSVHDPGYHGGAATEGGERVFSIASEPMTITVRPVEGVPAIDELEPIDGPIEPEPPGVAMKWPLIGLAAVAGLVAAGLVAARLWRARVARLEIVAPEEIAYRELEWLLAQGFTSRGEIKEFYFHSSRIVREYIERRFGLHAPDRTTEEFLAELGGSDALSAEHKALLARFLEQADRVKFALHEPADAEISASFEAAKQLIVGTRPRAQEEAHGAR